MASLPDFVVTAGDYVPAERFVHTGCQLDVWVFDIVPGAAARHIATTLDLAWPGRFVATADTVMLTRLRVAKVSSTNQYYDARGYMSETDIAFWLVVKDTVKGGNYWHPVYMFVDSASAMIAGREIFGFPKTIGIDKSKGADPALGFELHTDVIRMRGSSLSNEKLFELVPPGMTGPTPSPVTTRENLAGVTGRSMWKLTIPEPPGVLTRRAARPEMHPPYWPFADDPTAIPQFSMLTFKSFRDAAQSGKACVQQAIGIRTTSSNAVPFVGETQQMQLHVAPCETHPIAQEWFNFPIAKPIVSRAAYRVDLDFEIGLGAILADTMSPQP